VLDRVPFNRAKPDFSPTKFFAGRDTEHEAVIIYWSLRYLQMRGNEAAAENLVTRRVSFSIYSEIHTVFESIGFTL
jgi:hypothetical protein